MSTGPNPRKLPDILDCRTLAKTRLFCVESLKLRFSNGEEREFERLRGGGRGAVMIAAVPDPNTILLIREYGAGLERYELGLPKGVIEPNESPEQSANRELMEEVGMGARKLTVLKTLSLSPSYFTHCMTLVLAQDLYEQRLQGDEPEPIEVVPWRLDAIDELVMRNDITEARSIAALYMVRNYLRYNAS